MGRLKRIGLLSGMALATVNIWTGSPLLALWIGSRAVTGSGQATLGAIALVAIAIAVFSLLLIRVLGALQATYDEVTGQRRSIRRHTPWLRSSRGERPHEQPEGVRPSPVELMLIVSVVICVTAFEIWFFFYSGSPIDQRSGRD
jgi:hypothetical protein